MEHIKTTELRNVKQWKKVLTQRSSGLTYSEIGKLNGISRQRCYQIVYRAGKYAEAHDDELAKWIKGVLK